MNAHRQISGGRPLGDLAEQRPAHAVGGMGRHSQNDPVGTACTGSRPLAGCNPDSPLQLLQFSLQVLQALIGFLRPGREDLLIQDSPKAAGGEGIQAGAQIHGVTQGGDAGPNGFAGACHGRYFEIPAGQELILGSGEPPDPVPKGKVFQVAPQQRELQVGVHIDQAGKQSRAPEVTHFLSGVAPDHVRGRAKVLNARAMKHHRSLGNRRGADRDHPTGGENHEASTRGPNGARR